MQLKIHYVVKFNKFLMDPYTDFKKSRPQKERFSIYHIQENCTFWFRLNSL